LLIAVCPDLGIGLLPSYTVAEELKTGSVKQLFKRQDLQFNMSFDIVVKKNANRTAAETAFLNTMIRELCN
jgi:DNA-binding transcriptional LysR family regulator